ncbi:Chromosome partition protein Smc [Acinetobacter calcoaceticus]|nr:Chromosome partition protein Smc [Acinetobacter calcoaceticus]
MQIKRIHIQGFKSLEDVTFEPETGFGCLVGSNGAGKSNFCDALLFFKSIVLNGFQRTIEEVGYNNIFPIDNNTGGYASFELDIVDVLPSSYSLKINASENKIVSEKIILNGIVFYERIEEVSKFFDRKKYDEWNEVTRINQEKFEKMLADLKSGEIKEQSEIDQALQFLQRHNDELQEGLSIRETVPNCLAKISENLELSHDKTGLASFFDNFSLYNFLNGLQIFRVNPLSPKVPNKIFNKSNLLMHSENLATILSELKQDEEKWQTLHDWLNLIVPSISEVQVRQGEFDNSLNLQFIENNKALPAVSISDGTIYTLAILTAILWNIDKNTLIVIEEPERGIHPQAITELINFIREATEQNLNIITTTHSETFVRNCKLEELWIVDKIDGKTQLKSAKKENPHLEESSLDQAWLMNLFNGGLPW